MTTQCDQQTHVMSHYMPWEKYVTCCHCGKSLDDNKRMKDALKVNTTAGWAKHNLSILADMAKYRGLPDWFIDEIKRVQSGIDVLPT